MLILLAKQPPSWGIPLCPLAKGLFLLGLLAVYTSVEGWGRSQDPHLNIQLPPSTCSMQLCLKRTWPQRGAELCSLGKPRQTAAAE